MSIDRRGLYPLKDEESTKDDTLKRRMDEIVGEESQKFIESDENSTF
jgi:hypothetical protein